MLPSSPPERLRSASRSRSRSPSNYSLDLDALLDDDSSAIITPPRRNKIDVVHTDDIDGPSDFTQNLEYWMTAKLPIPTRPARKVSHGMYTAEQHVSSQVGFKNGEENDKNNLSHGSETPRREVDSMSPSVHTLETRSSTPQTVEHAPLPTNKELQASVEDHEDTPSRIRESSSAIGPTLRSPEFTLKSKPVSLEHEREQQHEESETVKHLLEALNKLRTELEEVKVQSQEQLGRVRSDFETQMEEHRTTSKAQLDTQELEWQTRMRDAATEHRNQLSRASNTRAQDKEMDTGQRDTDALLANKDRRISVLEASIEQQKVDLQAAHHDITGLKKKLENANEKYNTATEGHAEGHDRVQIELDSLRSRYKTLEASKLSADKRVEFVQAEIANLRLEHANDIDALTAQIEDASNTTQRAILRKTKDSQASMAELEQENSRLHSQLDDKDDEIDALKDELHQIRMQTSTSSEEMDKISAKLREQKTLNDQAAREIQSLRSGTKILQSRLDEVASTHSTSIDELEAQLSEANASRLEADAEVDELRTELVTMRQDYDVVNQAMDKRLQEVMKAREAAWEERLLSIRKEMGFRGAVLMREWGSKEMGLSEPQPYRYKYV